MANRPLALLQNLKSDLFDQGFDPERIEISRDMTVAAAAAASIRGSLLKKLRVENSTEADSAALTKFLKVNSNCKEWSLPSSLDEKTGMILEALRTLLDDFWHEGGYALCDHPFDMLARASVGPGANRRARGGSFYAKLFASPLTCSGPHLYNWYTRYIRRFPVWQAAENFRSSHYGPPAIVPSSKLSFVPKNVEVSRTICTEPTLNTMFQLGFGRILEQRLERLMGISLSDQQFKNRALARLGSLTDNVSTIDLSSASDSISMGMLREFLPATMLRQLEFSRCVSTEVSRVGTVELGMVSTMGNGFTFPLQTILFSAVVASCMSFHGLKWRPIRKNSEPFAGISWPNRIGAGSENSWGVFGDDIICPRSVTEDVIHILGLLGFSVNREKTFTEGPFRESCGYDFFQGVMVRGVYVKSLDTMQDCASVVNQLTRFSTRTGLSLRRTIMSLLDYYPEMPMVPLWEDMSAGYHVHLSHALKHGKAKWVKHKQWYSYHCRVPVPVVYRVREDGMSTPKGCKRLVFNPDGLMTSFLQGSIKSSSIGVRTDAVRWKTKRRICSNWDSTVHCRDAWSNDFGLDWARLIAVVEENE